MQLQEALKDTGLAESWFDGSTAIVVRKNEEYALSFQRGNKPPYIAHEQLTYDEVERELRAIHPLPPLEWSPVEMEG